ncbi:MAG: hypothetical protein HY718_20410, partial [Planctomycetes bacterium]|nr:hypothetical protein [Planctomycetota bacterium]
MTLLAVGCRLAETPRTTLSDPTIVYTSPREHYVVLRGGEIEAVVVDNAAVDVAVLPGHAAGYAGLASLKHAKHDKNVFVPAYGGLNYEHIFDGTTQPRNVLFEPRRVPMHLRVIDEHTVELHQPPTPHWRLESCIRYSLLADETIEMVFQCVPREKRFANGYIGVFFASYIDHPESGAIHFMGHDAAGRRPRLIEATSPRHGLQATHLAAGDRREVKHVTDFPLSLVFNLSDYRFDEPWYYGVSHGPGLGVPRSGPRAVQPVAHRRRRRLPGLGLPVVRRELRGRQDLHLRHACVVPAV